MRLTSCSAFLATFLFGSFASANSVHLRSKDELVSCLESSLSSQGKVILPGTAAFTSDTTRFSALDAPTFRVVSQVGNEDDVRASINCAKKTNTTFLFTGPRHAFNQNFDKINNGLEIFTNEGFSNIVVDAAANTVTVGGAVNFKSVINALYDAGKNIPVGSGPCVGIVGASLGAGLGRLQGLYGFTSDNMLSVNLMLANTSVITVSQTQNADLFWGIRGAGFNFGFVLNATYRVYEQRPNGENFNADFEWPLNMSEAFYTALKNEDMPAPLCVSTALGWNSTLNATTLKANAVYAGPESEGRKAVQFLVNIGGALRTNFTEVPWNEVAQTAFFNDGNDAILSCNFPVARRQIMGAGMNVIDPAANAKMSYQFDAVMRKYPQMRESDNSAYFCSQKGVLAYPDNSTSYSWRKAVGHQTWGWVYGDNTSTDATIGYAPQKIRSTIYNGANTSYPETYVGFSSGDETLETIFGAANLPHLAALKKRFDPKGYFDAYHPLPTSYATQPARLT